jgi:Arc/MetJ-type ribon-helix-helix transcriptional regulator
VATGVLGNPFWHPTGAPDCMAFCYAKCMAQLVTRVDDRLLAEVDDLVSEGVAATRSDAVRLGLEALVERHRRQQTGQTIVDAYRRQPQGDEELAGLDEATRALIEEEPW